MSQWLEACSIESFVCWCKVWLRTHVFSLQLHFGLQTPTQKKSGKKEGAVWTGEKFRTIFCFADASTFSSLSQLLLVHGSLFCSKAFHLLFSTYSSILRSEKNVLRSKQGPQKNSIEADLNFIFRDSFHAGSEIDWTGWKFRPIYWIKGFHFHFARLDIVYECWAIINWNVGALFALIQRQLFMIGKRDWLLAG